MKKKTALILSNIVAISIGIFLGITMSTATIAIGTSFIYGLVILIVAYIVHLIVHEAGHLLFGLLTGYKFISFRIGSMTLIKEDGEFKIKKYKIAGTAGQCLMAPPDCEPENTPFILYNAGGGLMNFILGVLMFMLCKIDNIYIETIGVMFLIMGVTCGLLNLIPLYIGVNNDGLNILSYRKKVNRVAFYNVLKLNYELTIGKRPRDIDEKYYTIPDGTVDDSIQNFIICRLEDEYKFEEIHNEIEKCLDKEMISVYKNEMKCSFILAKIMLDKSREEIDELMKDKELEKYIKATENYYLSRQTLFYAYNLLILNDSEKAQSNLKKIDELKKTYPIKGEIASAIELIKVIDDKRASKN